jgi:predicted transcriptional regulator
MSLFEIKKLYGRYDSNYGPPNKYFLLYQINNINKVMREFTDEKVELFELVSITDKYRIEGSSNIEKIINYGDIDLLEIA